MNDEVKNTNKELILNAYNYKIKIHIATLNKGWRNGYVKSTNNDFFVFDDDINPEPEGFFYIELFSVEPYIKRDNNKEVVE